MNRALLALLITFSLALPFSGAAQSDTKPASEQKDSKAGEQKDSKKKKKAKDDVEAIGDRNVGKGINFYSIDKEIALGKQFADEIERTAKMVDDPVISEYVNRVGQNLVRNSDAQVPFHFKVIDSDEVNAFALPGGFCFVNTGLLMKAESEGEFAGVLAHEIAHVTARHGTKQATRGQIANLATIPMAILLGGSWGGYAIQQAAGLAIPIGFLQFSRGFETEADYLGLQYLYKAGYDPTSFVDFFEKLQALEKRKPGALAGVFRSHPMTDDRIESAQKEIERILPSKPEYLVTTSEFLEVKDRFARLMAENREKKAGKDGPVLRRTSQPTGTIRPGDAGRPSEEEDGPPVLKRKDGEQPDAAADDDRPVLKRKDAEPAASSEPEVEAPPAVEPSAPTQPTAAPQDDGDRPILKRKG